MAYDRGLSVDENGQSAAFKWARLLLIALIIIGHISTMPHGPQAQEAFAHFGYNPSWLGVNTLFFLSGYMALRSLEGGHSIVQFLKSRAAHIFPTLIIYIALVAFVIFPIFGIKPNNINSLPAHLALYSLNIISCIDPGRLLPGLFDQAKYECVIQGAIWTFRWGVIAYIGTALGWKTGLLQSRKWLYAFTLLSLFAYVTLHSLQVYGMLSTPDFIGTALRLAWPFLAGMSVYALGPKLKRRWTIAALLIIATSAQYALLKWSPFIEVFATLSWCYIAFMLMTNQKAFPKMQQNVPDLALALYLFHWPTAQIMLQVFPESSSTGLFLLTAPTTIAISLIVHIALQNTITPLLQSQNKRKTKHVVKVIK